MDWTVWGSNPGGGEIFCAYPDWPWGPPSPLYNGYRVFHGGKAAGHGIDHPPPSSTEVKERVELYVYSPLRLRACTRVNFTFKCMIVRIEVTQKLRNFVFDMGCFHIHELE